MLASLLTTFATGTLAVPAISDFSAELTPDFRGWESTLFAGWRDWSGLDINGLIALPDDAATNATNTRIASTGSPFFIDADGDLCSLPGRFQLQYSSTGHGSIHEVFLQLSSSSLPDIQVALVYSVVPPDNDVLLPAEIIDLSPTERAYRFLLRPEGILPGTTGPVNSFVVEMNGPGDRSLCLDAVLLDTRFELEGEFQETGCPPPQPTSLGVFAGVDAAGSSVASDNLFRLTATGIPAGQFGYFICSQTFQWIPCPGPCSQGELCIGGAIARLVPAQSAQSAFSFQRTVDLTAIPLTPPVSVVSGSTWHFQAWYRDQNPGPVTNFTLPQSVLFQ